MKGFPKASSFPAMVALGLLCLGADEARAGSAVVSQGSVGFVSGQSIRVSVTNPAPEGAPEPLPALMTVRLLDANGRNLAVSPVITVGPGQTRTYIVRRNSLSLPGEPRTGRLQVRPETYLEIPSQPSPHAQLLVTLAEVVEDSTGKQSGMIGDVRTVVSAE